MRIPAIMTHPEYKKDPWATIRLHASNTLESAPTVGKPARAIGNIKVNGMTGDGMEGIDQCEFHGHHKYGCRADSGQRIVSSGSQLDWCYICVAAATGLNDSGTSMPTIRAVLAWIAVSAPPHHRPTNAGFRR